MIVKFISLATCAVGFLYSSYVLCNLTYFLSSHNKNLETDIRSDTDQNVLLSALWSLVVNMSLLSTFIVQHSFMASDAVKNLFFKLRIEYMNRTMYNFASAAALHLLMYQWQAIPWVAIWNINTSSSSALWLTFIAFHVFAWSIIYSGCLMVDISELTGLKQVYYEVTARPSSMELKSRGLLRYYAHMRHPSFIGFLIILWIHPLMTLDRILLAATLTTYMALMWNIDQDDHNYHVNMVRRKQRELF